MKSARACRFSGDGSVRPTDQPLAVSWLTPRAIATEHKDAMIDPLEALVPLLAGATHYNPSPLCVDDPKVDGEPLTDVGRKFAGLVYDLAVATERAADDAGSYLEPSEPIQPIGYQVEVRMALCVLFARALMEPDLPSSLSGP